MKNAESDNFVKLGLDIGTDSIGWALIEYQSNLPNRIIGTGARIFQAGLDNLTMDGKGESRNVDRRNARLIRRQNERRKRRLIKVANLLQRLELLPVGDYKDSKLKHEILNELDKKFPSVYDLRKESLDHQLELFQIGRIFYHMAQRRGFLSNRKDKLKDDEKGVIKESIKSIREQISLTQSRSLGELFSKFDTSLNRIRKNYTARDMYTDEFELIWNKQKEYYPDKFTELNRNKVYKAIFHQRPLKSQKHLVGHCELEKRRRRASWALLNTQKFRYLTTLNNLQVINNDGRTNSLTDEQRSILISLLDKSDKVGFKSIIEKLSLPKKTKFNLEANGDKNIIGNKTSSRIIKAIGEEAWDSFFPDQKNALINDILTIQKDEVLLKRAKEYWMLNEEQAENIASINLEEGYCSFSSHAIKKLLPHLEKNISLQTAIKDLYPDRFKPENESLDFLPLIKSEYMPELRNPVVERSLTELRKLVNALIKEYGKPEFICVELARDLRLSSKQRQEAVKKIKENERAREKAANIIYDEIGNENPSRNDILKIQLWEECNKQCPYTGKPISLSDLIGNQPLFDIEHIIPFHRSLDNSYINKTLCYSDENRNVKRGKTPYEAYHGTDKWDEIIERVKKFKSPLKFAKLERFEMSEKEVEELLSDFSSRQLNDTRYASKLAKKYLGLLYSGIDANGLDSNGKRRIFNTTGQVTSFMRNGWNLNSILADGDYKTRDDHRHHAIDALVTALTDTKTVKNLSVAAKRGFNISRLIDELELPWENFYQEANEAILNIVTSHRFSNRVRGALHQDTNYGNPKIENGKEVVHTRISVDALTPNIDNIVDKKVKEAIERKLDELGEKEPKKAFKDYNNHPVLFSNNGYSIPIHRVTIKRNLNTFKVGNEPFHRNVISDSNHHMEIFEQLDENGKTIGWDAEVVSMFDAYQRKKNKEPIINTKFGQGKNFLFSLACGDIIELDEKNGSRNLFVVRTVPKSKQIRFVPINDARKLNDIPKQNMTAYPNTLRSKNCQKVTITYLGLLRNTGRN